MVVVVVGWLLGWGLVCVYVCMYVYTCPLFSVVRCSTRARVLYALDVTPSFFWTGHAECMITEESTTSSSCALHSPGRSVGVVGGHEKKRHTRLRCRPMCVVNTCVTCYVLLCGTARVPRCVHPFRVCAVLCNTVLVCAALRCHFLFLAVGGCRVHDRCRAS